MNTVTTYQVIDVKTGGVVSTHKTRNGATRAADNRDRKYGAVRYIVKPIFN